MTLVGVSSRKQGWTKGRILKKALILYWGLIVIKVVIWCSAIHKNDIHLPEPTRESCIVGGCFINTSLSLSLYIYTGIYTHTHKHIHTRKHTWSNVRSYLKWSHPFLAGLQPCALLWRTPGAALDKLLELAGPNTSSSTDYCLQNIVWLSKVMPVPWWPHGVWHS